jgi:hypothetical protein
MSINFSPGLLSASVTTHAWSAARLVTLPLLLTALLALPGSSFAQRPAGLATRPNPVVGISGNGKRLTIQAGTSAPVEEFIIFFSYFDALDQSPATITSTLETAWNAGFTGVRVFPNWWDNITPGNPTTCVADTNPLIMSNGQLNATTRNQLVHLLNESARLGLIIDISFAMETVQGLTVENYLTGIATVVSQMGTSWKNAFIDVANEYDFGASGSCKPTAFSPATIAFGLAQLRNLGTGRLFTASTAEFNTAATAADKADDATVAFDTPHNPRSGAWWNNVHQYVVAERASQSTPRPIVLQEPAQDMGGGTATPYSLIFEEYTINGQTVTLRDVFTKAAAFAKYAGAAGYTFHTEYGPLFGSAAIQQNRANNLVPGWTNTEGTFLSDFWRELLKVPCEPGRC